MSQTSKLQLFLVTSSLLGYLFMTLYLTKLDRSCNPQQTGIIAQTMKKNGNSRNVDSQGGATRRIFADSETEDGDMQPHLRYLNPDLVPGTVHYIWCGRRIFKFHHYLSILSVIKMIKPDKIVIHYEHFPRMDEKYYHRWCDELREEFPFLLLERLQESSACSRNTEKQLTYIALLLSERGGVYVSEHTIITKFPLSLRNYTLFVSYHNFTGYVIAKQNAIHSVDLHNLHNNERTDVMKGHCASIEDYVVDSDGFGCVNVYDSFYPQDIWYRDDAFGRLVRRVYYDKEDFPIPSRSDDDLIPNIAHMVWLKGTNIDFLFYLSMLSVIHVAGVDVLYLYGDKEPTGYYWNRLKHHPRLKFIRREIPETIYQQGVKELAHISDIWRVDLITKYGGIYADADAIFVKPISRHMRGYDAVATYDWPQWNLPFPEIINFGVSMGKKNNAFFKLFRESMKFWREESWTFNGLRQPYKVFEKHPDLLHIEPHFQVICFYYKCHPTWNADFHNINISHLNTPFDWRTDANALHLTYPTPPELRSHRRFLRANRTMFTDVARFVLRKANITDWKY